MSARAGLDLAARLVVAGVDLTAGGVKRNRYSTALMAARARRIQCSMSRPSALCLPRASREIARASSSAQVPLPFAARAQPLSGHSRHAGRLPSGILGRGQISRAGCPPSGCHHPPEVIVCQTAMTVSRTARRRTTLGQPRRRSLLLRTRSFAIAPCVGASRFSNLLAPCMRNLTDESDRLQVSDADLEASIGIDLRSQTSFAVCRRN